VLKSGSLAPLRYLLIDIGLTLLALRLARSLREIIPLGVYLDEPLRFSPLLYAIVAVIWIVVFATLKIYSPARALRYTEDLPAVWGAITGATLIFAGVAYLLFRELSRFLFFYFYVLDLVLLSGWRWLLPSFPALAGRLHGAHRRRVLIVGASAAGRALGEAITAYPATDLTVVGFADDYLATLCPEFDEGPRPATGGSVEGHSPATGGSVEGQPGDSLGYPVLGGLRDVPRLAQDYEVQEIVFALPPEGQSVLRSLVLDLQTVPANLRLVPDVFDLVFIRASVEEFEGIPLIGLREPAIDGLDRLVKRLFDLTLSGLLVLVLSPLMLAVALLIKLDTPGPVLFRQRRVGEAGRLFWMLKFRSMVEGAEQKETDLLQDTLDGRPRFAKTPYDPRVTRVGRFLRRASLDELPQVLNVLKGEMSLVGPRPELPWLVDLYEPWQRKRFAVPQGITGWWQVNGRMNRADPIQRLEDDLFYIRNYSLWLDLRILWRTVKAVVHGEGAY
jgi:lipopolysaccharide/colanic/teichoic acid biosynthesis glycosyltransferase